MSANDDELHEHEHCGCGCEHGHDHGHDHDGCGCGCEHGHDREHERCGCGDPACHDHEAAEPRQLSDEPSMSYHVLGLDCPSCASGTEDAVRDLECIDDARLTYATATLDVVMNEGADPDHVRKHVLTTVRSRGQDLDLSEEERADLQADRPWIVEHREQILMGISGIALACGLVLEHLMGLETASIVAYVIAAVAGLVFVTPMGLASLRRGAADMNVLMSIAVIGGLVIGFSGDSSTFGDAAIVIFLDQVGEWLEGWSMRRTSGSIAKLMDLAPTVAHVLDEAGNTTDRGVGDVAMDTVIRVLPGERVPLDGVIVTGSSSFNEAPVTGESVPADKTVGADVFAGSLNTSGVVDVRVTAEEDSTTLARIVKMVQGAQASKAPYESFVDRFAAVYTPAVIAAALVVGVVVPLVIMASGHATPTLWHDWIYRALSLLVVACPCALVISTPVTFVSAITRAARDGVLVKGGAYLDIASRVQTIAFDKTGTLTRGMPSVTTTYAVNFEDADRVLAYAAALEASSTHPLARAVCEAAEERGLLSAQATDVTEVTAEGMSGIVDGHKVTCGKPSLANVEATDEFKRAYENICNTGATSLVVSIDGDFAGIVGVADTLRDNAASSIADLREKAGVQTIEMLTGDNETAATAIGKAAGVTHVVSNLLPGGKVAYVKDMQAAGATVAFVGDGINDAPALATADLGITMGAAASDTALEVADVALLSDDLAQLPPLLRLARRTMSTVRVNIGLAIAVKAVVFVLVIMGVAGMGAAVFADTGVALLVILNGMRLML